MGVDSYVLTYSPGLKELLLYRITEQNKIGRLREYINQVKNGKY